MDGLIYFITVLVTVGWSIWIYFLWNRKIGLSEDSWLRFLLILSPSSYFLLLVISGWQKTSFFRLDLVGLLAIDILTLLLTLLLAVFLKLFSQKLKKKAYISILLVYNIISVVIVAGAHILRNSAPLLMRFSSLVYHLGRLDFFSVDTASLNPDTQQQYIRSILNKVIIALCTYIPISVVRSAYANHQRAKLQKEYEQLKTQLYELDKQMKALTDNKKQ